MMTCTGRGTKSGDHCCYVNGEPCVYVRENVAGRRYACGLMVELGSWEAVAKDPRYAPIQAHWDSVGIKSCGEWQPPPGQCCREER